MNIKEMVLEGFTKHRKTRLVFPDKGLVLVTGKNGSGKSSIAEAPSVAFWGETLRGANPWGAAQGQVTVITDKVTATRTRKGTRTTLQWSLPGEAAVEYETTTKGQEALEKIVGSFELWQRSRVFSSQDAAHFTMATDAERKRLLESLLGLDRFDSALEEAKADLKVAAATEAAASLARVQAEAALGMVRSRIQEAEATRPTDAAVDLEALRAKATQLERFAADAMRELTEETAKLTDLARGGGAREATLASAQRRLAKLKGSECGECGQPINPKLRDELQDLVAKEAAAIDREKKEAAAQEAAIRATCRDLQADYQKLQRQVSEVRSTIATAAAAQKQKEALEKRLTELRPAEAEAQAALQKTEDRVTATKEVVAELTACVAVLGIKGVRAHVLGKSLSGLEAVANAWLARIAGPGLTLSLKPYTEKKTGGMMDAISLEVEGAGGGHGYKASSGGERRRIDVSLLLALAEVARAAHNDSPGTLFFDECFDTLDGDGIDGVSATLNLLAQDRCVVVITHNPALTPALSPAVRWEVDDGQVRAV